MSADGLEAGRTSLPHPECPEFRFFLLIESGWLQDIGGRNYDPQSHHHVGTLVFGRAEVIGASWSSLLLFPLSNAPIGDRY